MLLNEPVERFISNNIVDPEGIINQLSLFSFIRKYLCCRGGSPATYQPGQEAPAQPPPAPPPSKAVSVSRVNVLSLSVITDHFIPNITKS